MADATEQREKCWLETAAAIVLGAMLHVRGHSLALKRNKINLCSIQSGQPSRFAFRAKFTLKNKNKWMAIFLKRIKKVHLLFIYFLLGTCKALHLQSLDQGCNARPLWTFPSALCHYLQTGSVMDYKCTDYTDKLQDRTCSLFIQKWQWRGWTPTSYYGKKTEKPLLSAICIIRHVRFRS